MIPGNSYTTEFRQYDPRLARWKSLDPLMMKFPWMSPYVAFDNNPVFYTDPFGLEATNDGDGGGNPCDYGACDENGDVIDPSRDGGGNPSDYGVDPEKGNATSENGETNSSQKGYKDYTKVSPEKHEEWKNQNRSSQSPPLNIITPGIHYNAENGNNYLDWNPKREVVGLSGQIQGEKIGVPLIYQISGDSRKRTYLLEPILIKSPVMQIGLRAMTNSFGNTTTARTTATSVQNNILRDIQELLNQGVSPGDIQVNIQFYHNIEGATNINSINNSFQVGMNSFIQVIQGVLSGSSLNNQGVTGFLPDSSANGRSTLKAIITISILTENYSYD